METSAWVLIAFIIIVVIIVVAWVIHIYFNRNSNLQNVNVGGGSGGGGGGGNGPVPDNFSSLYNQLQSGIKTMDEKIVKMRFWLITELERNTKCKEAIDRGGLGQLFMTFEADWANFKSDATLPVSTIYNSTYEILLSSDEAVTKTMKELGILSTSNRYKLAWSFICNSTWAKNFIEAGQDAAESLTKISAIVGEMVKISRG